MSSTAELTAQPSWSVRPMLLEQVPLVVSWIAAIDPTTEIDQTGIADRMRREMEVAIRKRLADYHIGYFENLSTFFLEGFQLEKQTVFLPPLSGAGKDYEIATLLISPLIGNELHLPLYHQAVRFIFDAVVVDRIVYQIDKTNEFLAAVLLGLGFRELGHADAGDTRVWYGCRRSEFIGM
jgi:hypothetical protein